MQTVHIYNLKGGRRSFHIENDLDWFPQMLCDAENDVAMKVVFDLMHTFSNEYFKHGINRICALKFIGGTLTVFFWGKPSDTSIMRAVDIWEGLMMQKSCQIESLLI